MAEIIGPRDKYMDDTGGKEACLSIIAGINIDEHTTPADIRAAYLARQGAFEDRMHGDCNVDGEEGNFLENIMVQTSAENRFKEALERKRQEVRDRIWASYNDSINLKAKAMAKARTEDRANARPEIAIDARSPELVYKDWNVAAITDDNVVDTVKDGFEDAFDSIHGLTGKVHQRIMTPRHSREFGVKGGGAVFRKKGPSNDMILEERKAAQDTEKQLKTMLRKAVLRK